MARKKKRAKVSRSHMVQEPVYGGVHHGEVWEYLREIHPDKGWVIGESMLRDWGDIKTYRLLWYIGYPWHGKAICHYWKNAASGSLSFIRLVLAGHQEVPRGKYFTIPITENWKEDLKEGIKRMIEQVPLCGRCKTMMDKNGKWYCHECYDRERQEAYDKMTDEEKEEYDEKEEEEMNASELLGEARQMAFYRRSVNSGSDEWAHMVGDEC
jgi:ribosomal protein L37AE/L43A